MKPTKEMPAPVAGAIKVNGEKVKTTIHVGSNLEIGKENADAIFAQQEMYKTSYGKTITDNEAVQIMLPETEEHYLIIAEHLKEIRKLVLDSDGA